MRIDVHVHHHHHHDDRPVMEAVGSMKGAVMARFDNLDAAIAAVDSAGDDLAADVDEIIAALQSNQTPDTSEQESRLAGIVDRLRGFGTKLDDAHAPAEPPAEPPVDNPPVDNPPVEPPA